jgi:hypothetical protein
MMSDLENTRVNECDDDGMDAWWEDRNLPQKILIVVGFVVLGAGLLFLFGWVVMLLWNWLMPDIFGLKTLSYWQAWGVLALSCILFGRIGGHGGGGGKTDRKRKQTLRGYMREAQRVHEDEARKQAEKEAAGGSPEGAGA